MKSIWMHMSPTFTESGLVFLAAISCHIADAVSAER